MPNKKNYTLLLVDDDRMIRTIYEYTFGEKFNVAIASNGKEALELLALKNFDAVITDINMPEMSGIELTKAIRNADTSYNNILILGVTATPKMIEAEVSMPGMNKIFFKPVELTEIEDYLNDAFSNPSQTPSFLTTKVNPKEKSDETTAETKTKH